MAAEEEKSPNNAQNLPRRSPRTTMKEDSLSPGFRSAAAMAGWDEEALLLASLVVEDTPVRESRHRKRPSPQFKTPPTTNTNRKRRSRRQSSNPIPPVVLCLDDDEDEEQTVAKKDPGAKRKDSEVVVAAEEKNSEGEGAPAEKASSNGLPCMDRLREELSCAICLDICFEPSTTPCGHSFCMKCLKCAAAKCGKRCPKCRQLISNGRSCMVNTVLWNTIQLLFPEEVEARKNSIAATPRSSNVQSPERSSSNITNSHASSNTSSGHRRSATQVSRVMDRERIIRRRAMPNQSEDAALALRLQREEFMVAFHDSREQQRSTLHSARANLRAMASRAVHFRTRGQSA